MGKVSPKDSDSKISTRKKKLKSSNNKYLKPGALVQLCYSKASATAKSNNDLGKKRVPVFDTKPARSSVIAVEDVSSPRSPLVSSPVKRSSLVKIVCHLHHDELKAVFHVSQRIRAAAVIARQYHFNYTTPDRSRQEMLSVLTPMPINRWPFVSKGDGNSRIMGSPHTPKAPRHAPRPPCRTKLAEMKQITAVLFQDPTAFPSRCSVPSVLQRPTLFKPLAPKHPRVLFYEDELCQAVAQNNLQ
ncbi:hypothetical protein Bca4012_080973 [Brassica carinata]